MYQEDKDKEQDGGNISVSEYSIEDSKIDDDFLSSYTLSNNYVSSGGNNSVNLSSYSSDNSTSSNKKYESDDDLVISELWGFNF